MPITIRNATIEDASLILHFVTELAIYEKAEHEVIATTKDIQNTLFGEHSSAHALICELDEKPIGFAVYFYNYSTWLGKNGLYLEDLYISAKHRGAGAGIPMPKKHTMPYGLNTPPIKAALKWKLGGLLQKKRATVPDDDVILTVHTLTEISLQRDEDFIVWLGHATFLIQLDGVRILTDSVFGSVPLTPRLIELPIDPTLLKPDVIMISHGH